MSKIDEYDPSFWLLPKIGSLEYRPKASSLLNFSVKRFISKKPVVILVLAAKNISGGSNKNKLSHRAWQSTLMFWPCHSIWQNTHYFQINSLFLRALVVYRNTEYFLTVLWSILAGNRTVNHNAQRTLSRSVCNGRKNIVTTSIQTQFNFFPRKQQIIWESTMLVIIKIGKSVFS